MIDLKARWANKVQETATEIVEPEPPKPVPKPATQLMREMKEPWKAKERRLALQAKKRGFITAKTYRDYLRSR